MRIGVDLDNTIFCTREQYEKYQKKYILENNITEEELWKNKKYKLDSCLENHIDIMIDDSKYIIDDLKDRIDCLLYDDIGIYSDCDCKVNSWKEIDEKIGVD